MLLNRSRDYTLYVTELTEYLCHKRSRMCSVCRNHNPVLSPFMTFHRAVTRVTLIQWVPLVEQQLLTLAEHMSSLTVFSWVRVAHSLVFCVMFCRSLFVLLFFLFFWPLYCL